MTQHVEWYRKYRPTALEEVVGQPRAVALLSDLFGKGAFPHATLLYGPSGTGKSTVARIIRTRLGCADIDFREINAADKRLLEDVREVIASLAGAPLGGRCRVWLWEEAHFLSRKDNGDAQTALLHVLEHPPRHCYFILTTTDPEQLRVTVRNRCTQIQLEPLSQKDLLVLLSYVSVKENATVGSDLLVKIAERAQGCAREAVQLLQAACSLPEEQRLDFVAKQDAQAKAMDLVKALVWRKASWKEVAGIINSLGDEDPEKLRHLVLACASKEILKADKRTQDRAYAILLSFEGDWFASKRAGLVRACYEVFRQKE